jgi:hypothetical protein
MPSSTFRTILAATLLFAGSSAATAGGLGTDITTYHYDNLRTGWNQQETALTPASVKGGTFTRLHVTALDDQVDAQPLILSHQSVNGHTAREVAYVATESNSVYAIDANTGHILLQANFGTPVPFTALPGSCNNNGPNIGINSTPVIDPATHTIYVVTDTYEDNNAVYRIHALSPSTLTDLVSPVTISASGKLSDGSTYNFNPFASRLRAALLIANGNVYAGFASYCDVNADLSRGWVLGWNLNTLTPLAKNHLNNQLAHSTDDFFLTSVWMSGYGLASSVAGDIYFVTGNSDYSGDSYNRVRNLAESVVQMSSDLSTVKGFFTPQGDLGWQNLDQADADFGSGGAMLLPPQPGQSNNIAVAAGKVGQLYILNADDISNGKPKTGKAFGAVDIGSCWCGPSYYTASDGTGRVVSSGNNTVGVWKVGAGGAHPKLALKINPGSVDGDQFPGFFTSVSSNGTAAHSAVIWAVGRPVDSSPAHISLYAFDPEHEGTLFSAVAGAWPNTGGDSNTVPVSANGKVYVASNQQLAIFGLGTAGAEPAALVEPKVVDMRAKLAPGEHEIYGTVRAIDGKTVTIARRDGQLLKIDTARAAESFDLAAPWIGHALLARGTLGDAGMQASIVMHAKGHPAMWPSDR